MPKCAKCDLPTTNKFICPDCEIGLKTFLSQVDKNPIDGRVEDIVPVDKVYADDLFFDAESSPIRRKR